MTSAVEQPWREVDDMIARMQRATAAFNLGKALAAQKPARRRARETDQWGRPVYRDDEIPSPTDLFAVWRDRLTHPSEVSMPAVRDHTFVCVGGWIASGSWWLHCGRCRSWMVKL